MAKQTSYNKMSREELILALTKAKGELRGLALEKSKTGNAKSRVLNFII
jgi:hypothetical protein